MKLLTLAVTALYMLFAPLMMAQNASPDSYLVTFYQLSYRPDKAAHKSFQAGSKLIEQHDYQGGIVFMRQALIQDPDYWLAANDMGFAYIHLLEHAKAEQAFQTAIDIDPQNAIGYANMGVAAASLFDFKLAEQSGRRALRLNPLLPQAKLLIATIDIAQGRWTPEARKMLEDIESFIPFAKRILQEWPEHPSRASHVELLRSALP